MGWNWNWLSPWEHAISHALKVREELHRKKADGVQGVKQLLDDIFLIIDRYERGERTVKLYSAMFSITLKGIEKYVK